MQLVDIVNFNADASCLACDVWLAALSGGANSTFCRWLRLYIDYHKPMVLGMTGATVSDLAIHNPEAIAIITAHRAIFQVILRPYAHDISLLRTPAGFAFNLAMGKAVLSSVLAGDCRYYLPPEFMLMNEQLALLKLHGVTCTFINPDRFPPEHAERIYRRPYVVTGVAGAALGCIPVDGRLTGHYLRTIQLWDQQLWHALLAESDSSPRYLWRDGESCFLLPDGLAREAFWLAGCPFVRTHLDLPVYTHDLPAGSFKSYPLHAFSSWMKEFRMLGYLNRVYEIEKSLTSLPLLQKYMWLLVINSDILSAVEKDTPSVQIKPSVNSSDASVFRIARSERGFEGEEYLYFLEKNLPGNDLFMDLAASELPHHRKALGRLAHLMSLNLDA